MPTVLVVDDNKQMADTIARMATLLDWKVEIALGSRSALEKIRRMQPQLILLDMNMPGIDGGEVLKFVKRDPLLTKTAVVFISAEGTPDVQEKMRTLGALDYLLKPIDLDQLEAVFKKVFPSENEQPKTP